MKISLPLGINRGKPKGRKEYKMTDISRHYEAWAMSMGSKLAQIADTLQEMREEIDASNQRAKDRGYKAEQWMIVSVSYRREMDGNRFVKAIREEEYVETYPQEV